MAAVFLAPFPEASPRHLPTCPTYSRGFFHPPIRCDVGPHRCEAHEEEEHGRVHLDALVSRRAPPFPLSPSTSGPMADKKILARSPSQLVRARVPVLLHPDSDTQDDVLIS
jgi:hypothetical protein